MSTQALKSWSRSSADIPIKQIAPNISEVPQDYQPGMKVPARIYAAEDLLAKMRTDRTIQQCVNVTHLTGIYKYAITMSFFFSSRRRHTRLQGDWSSDVCSSD